MHTIWIAIGAVVVFWIAVGVWVVIVGITESVSDALWRDASASDPKLTHEIKSGRIRKIKIVK